MIAGNDINKRDTPRLIASIRSFVQSFVAQSDIPVRWHDDAAAVTSLNLVQTCRHAHKRSHVNKQINSGSIPIPIPIQLSSL